MNQNDKDEQYYSQTFVNILAFFVNFLGYDKKNNIIYIDTTTLRLDTILENIKKICEIYQILYISIPIFMYNSLDECHITFNFKNSKDNFTMFDTSNIDKNSGIKQFKHIKNVAEYLNIDQHYGILKEVGSFLLRNSSEPNMYTLSIKLEDKIWNDRFNTLEKFYAVLSQGKEKLNDNEVLKMPPLRELENKINVNKVKAITTLCCIREFCDSESLLGNDYLPLNMFKLLLSEFK